MTQLPPEPLVPDKHADHSTPEEGRAEHHSRAALYSGDAKGGGGAQERSRAIRARPKLIA